MSLQPINDADIARANERDQGTDLATLAAELGLALDPDDWDYPKFRDARGRAVVGRCSDLRWRWFDHDGNEPSFSTATEAFASREVKS